MEKMQADVSIGPALRYLANINSGDSFFVIADYVQNAIDENAKNITVTVSKDKITIEDDGNGISKTDMIKKLKNICTSFKNETQLGEFGIGNISGLSIAQFYTFYSHDPRTKEPFCVYIDKNNFFESAEVEIRDKDDLNDKFLKNVLNNKTIVVLKNVDRRAIKKICKKPEELEAHLATRFSERIKEKNIRITLNFKKLNKTILVKPHQFEGKQIKKEYCCNLGKIIFDFYLDDKYHKNPAILIDHKGDKINLFGCSQIFDDLSEKAKQDLSWGYIQGTIKFDECFATKLSYAANRCSFQTGPALDELITAIKKFCEEKIHTIKENFEKKAKQTKWKKLLQEALKKLQEHLEKEGLELPETIKGIVKKSGEIKINRPEKIMSDIVRERENNLNKSQKKIQHSSKPKEVKIVDYVSWLSPIRSKVENGVIKINVSHQDWAKAEESGDATLKNYICILISFEATREGIESAYKKEDFEDNFEEFMKFYRAFL